MKKLRAQRRVTTCIAATWYRKRTEGDITPCTMLLKDQVLAIPPTHAWPTHTVRSPREGAVTVGPNQGMSYVQQV